MTLLMNMIFYFFLALILFSSIGAVIRACIGFKKLKHFSSADKKSKLTYSILSAVHMISGIVVILFIIILLLFLLVYSINQSMTDTPMSVKMLMGLSGLAFLLFASCALMAAAICPLIIGGTGLAMNNIQKQKNDIEIRLLAQIHTFISFGVPFVFLLIPFIK